MTYEPLHHKYRPQTFRDLVGQETIALTLSNAIEQAKIAPAYLFTGPRGTGKTSSARILAKSLNCLHSNKPTANPCGKCEVCLAIARGTALDVMEIDAASNTGVDNIREIIERSRFAPVQCRYKVYAIDECHMLSTAAFNALLKTLEEPPPNVVFILATTDPQRVLSTIISRCQRFDYRRIPLAEMVEHLKYIATEENIAIADDALTLVAQIANGGLRDAESLLDQLSLLPETITVAKVWDLVGAVPELDLLKLLKAIRSGRTAEIIQQCRSLLDRGREPLVVLQNLASFYLNLLIAKTAPNNSEMVAVTENCWQELCNEAANWQIETILQGQQQLKTAETQLKQTTQPRLWLEITLLGLLSTAERIETLTPRLAVETQSDRATVRESPHYNNGTASNFVKPKSQPNLAASAQSTNEADKHQNDRVAKLEATETSKTAEKPAAVNSVKQDVKRDLAVTAKDNKSERENAPNDEVSSVPVERNSQVVEFKSKLPADANSKNEVSEPVSNTATSNAENTDSSDPVANQAIWKKVIECLQPPTTQALLRQQCHLISLEDSRAIVGIGSAKLQRLHQGKVTNIETAFAKVCQRSVKVKLEVATSQKSPVGDAVSTSPPQPKTELPPEAKSSLAREASSPITSQPVREPPSSHNGVSSDLVESRALEPTTYSDVPSLPPPKKNIAKPIAFPSPVTSEVAPPPTANEPAIGTPPETEVTPISLISVGDAKNEDDLEIAIAELTRCFEGELVQLDSQVVEPPELSLSTDAVNEEHSETQSQLSSELNDLDLPTSSSEPRRQNLSSFPASNNIVIKRGEVDSYDDDEDVPF
ncbi:DNA polymerase III subunit gamma/tau [Myxosarcina sp. GI1]|uniref:DNA polymerase III subunit gamma/tau n=1 Tax=Myxosarcina sp. GI1 TaxID=1541065 RepID=UPI0009079021|nr:DNA polymerase III subunit gamma/tau [Myxosarcina sp. GI1]